MTPPRRRRLIKKGEIQQVINHDLPHFQCPICNRYFMNNEERLRHCMMTKQHESLISWALSLKFLLLLTEEDNKILKQQRDDAREKLKELSYES